MSSVRIHAGTLFFDFRYQGIRCREYTKLPDTAANRERMQKALDKLEQTIATSTFHYSEFFPGSKLAAKFDVGSAPTTSNVAPSPRVQAETPLFRTFIEEWFTESLPAWRHSHMATIRSTLDLHLIPYFGDMAVGDIAKADILQFRAEVAQRKGRNGNDTGRAVTENDPPLPVSDAYPRASEATAMTVAANGVNVSVMRLPQVHDPVKQGLVTAAIQIYREKGVCAYVGDGLNRWPAVHVLDAARAYRLALEKAEPGSKYHAVAEEGVPLRDVAETIGRHLKLPVKSISSADARDFSGWYGMFGGPDGPASGAQTRKKLGWEPVGLTLLADLEQGVYAE